MSFASSLPAFVKIHPSRLERSSSLYSFKRSIVRTVKLTCACPARRPVLIVKLNKKSPKPARGEATEC